MNPTSGAIRVSVVLLAALATAAALRVAEPLLSPILVAMVIGVVLAPMTDRLVSAGVPAPLGALSGLLLTVALAALFVLFLEPYVSQLIRRAPLLWIEAQELIINLRRVLRGMEQVADSVAEALDTGGAAANTAKESVSDKLPDVTDAIGYAPALAGQILIFLGTLFFFLFSRAEVYALITRLLPHVDMERLFEAERLVSRYFLTISFINAGLGALVTICLAAIGMPSPVVWGVLAFALNFVPYIGPAVYSVALGIAGLLVFDGLWGLAPVGIFIGLNMIEGQFVTPTLIGRTLAINPLMVFLTLTFWLWLWGAAGGIVALPLLIWALALTKDRDRPKVLLAE